MNRDVRRRGRDRSRQGLTAGRAVGGEPAALAHAVLALREEFDRAERAADGGRREIAWSDLERVLRLSVNSTGAGAGAIVVADEDSDELVAMVTMGGQPRSAGRARVPDGEGVRGWVYQHQRVADVPAFGEDTRCQNPADLAINGKIRNLIAAPIAGGGRRLGVLEVANKRQGGAFTAVDEALVALFARAVWRWLRAFERQERAGEVA